MEAGWQYAPLTFRVSAVSILQDRHALIIVRQPPKASRRSYLSTPPTPPSLHQQRITTHPQQSRSTHQLYLSTPSNRSTRWTGQTCLTNSQAANHERRMVRCSPRAPGFSREQSTSILWVLAVSNPHDIYYEGWPILLPWRFPGRQVPNLTTKTSDSSFFQLIHLQHISTQDLAKNHYPPSTVRQYTPATPFPHPQFPSFCKREDTPHTEPCDLSPFSWQ